jgi:hypothetical protein
MVHARPQVSRQPLDGTEMELFGLILFVPFAAVASATYAGIARRVFGRFPALGVLARWISYAVLLILAVELLSLGTLGIVRSREILGLPFLAIHAIAFILAPAALANVLVLAMQSRTSWFVAAAAATCLAIGLVFLNIQVSETLYGIDGSGGPYGKPGWLGFPAGAV